MRKLTTEIFIEKAKKVHGDKYDYSKVHYVDATTKVCIICPIHGEFWMTPANHLNGQGCKKCGVLKRANERKMTKDEFIILATKKHNGKFDYSKVEYVNCDTPVCIICPIHGEFWQTPYHHLHDNSCPKCGHRTCAYDTNEWIKEARKVHGDTYDYSKVKYVDANTKVCIICPIHGEFYVRPINHLRGSGCPKCVGKNKTTEDFINESVAIHGEKYDYSKVVYKGAYIPVCIICPIHGEFWQTPHSHLSGCGCQICKESKLEKEVRKFLKKSNIDFTRQKRFYWLNKQSLDFYLPEYNIAIECQGRQHFESVKHFGGEETLFKNKSFDEKKYNLCMEHNIKVKYFTLEELMKYTDSSFIYNNNLSCDIKKLLEIINKN